MLLLHIPGDESRQNLRKIDIFSELFLYGVVGVIAGFTKDGETAISIASILKKNLKLTNWYC
jgi:hypothetical protein